MSDNLPKYFPKVREAREALAAKALEIYEKHMKLIQMAMDVGELDVASKHLQWLSEHLPSVDGVTMIDSSVDTPKPPESGPSGPQITIGFQLGGISPTKSLPEPITVEAEKIPVKDHE